jgi:hypothetical protein
MKFRVNTAAFSFDEPLSARSDAVDGGGTAPEPPAWVIMLLGFAGLGSPSLRRPRSNTRAAVGQEGVGPMASPRRLHQYFSGILGLLATLASTLPAKANGVDIGTYTGTFTNLDQNFGSYMLWTATFGDPNALGAIYAPVEFTTFVSNSFATSGGTGGGSITDATIYGDACSIPACTAHILIGNHSDLIGGDSFGRAGVWFFNDVYFGGTQTFTFHFTDPPGSGTLAPMPFSLVETNHLAGGALVGSPQGFSLTINPDGTIQDVNVTGMLLTGPGVGPVTSVPEPPTWAMMLLGFAGLGYVGWRQTAKCKAALA